VQHLRPSTIGRSVSRLSSVRRIELEALEPRQLLSAGVGPLDIGDPVTQIGKDSPSGQTKAVFVDANGTQIKFSLKGPGVASITGPNGSLGYTLAFTGTDTTSSFSMKPNKLGDGEAYLIGDSTADGGLKSFKARFVNLNGTFTSTGPVLSFIADDIGEVDSGEPTTPDDEVPHVISIGNAGAAPTDAVKLIFDDASDLELTSLIPVAKLTATSWSNFDATPDQLTAPSLAQLVAKAAKGSVIGSFEMNIALTDPASTVTKLNLKKSSLENAVIRTAGSINTVTAGAIINSTIFAGVDDSAADDALPDAADLGDAVIGSIKVKGGLFTNSNIAAGTITSISLATPVAQGGAADAFGFRAQSVTKYKSTTAKLNAAALETPGDYDILGQYRLSIVA
jgi:hypothetical protein